MPGAITLEQMRRAVLDVLAGNVPPVIAAPFDNYINLKIGARANLAREGLREPQPPIWPMDESALSEAEEVIYKRVYDQLVREGVILEKHGTDIFTVVLLPEPFSKSWQYVQSLDGGGQGSTRKVRRVSDGVLGVLKIPHSTEENSAKRFIREVIILHEINHPAIVRLLDANLDAANGAMGYVTPFGVPLVTYWNERVPSLTPTQRYDQTYRIVRQLAEGLQVFHQKGGTHRDLKPENIIFLEDRPVIIDFGVAWRVGDERLSKIEGRPVANNFATPPSAHYGLHDGGPPWDCLGLAWIYGFLLGEGTKPKQFHWRFHPLIEEARSQRAKALLAACSHERTVPENAGAFVGLMDRLLLGGSESVTAATIAPNNSLMEGAILAHTEARTARELLTAEHTELAEANIQILEGPLTELRAQLNQVCRGNERLPVVQNTYNGDDPLDTPVMPNRPMAAMLQQVFQQASASGQMNECIFSCTCGTFPRQFEIRVFVGYTLHFVPDGLQFRLLMWCRNVGGDQQPPGPEVLLDLKRDGSFANTETGKAMSRDDVVNVVFGWMTDKHRWRMNG